MAGTTDIARGVGPRWLRIGLAALAVAYYVALVEHPPNRGALRSISFFTSATCLFPKSSTYAIDYRLAVWSCSDNKWEPLDHRPYFPIRADDKESRFQRLAYFYKSNHTAMHALDDFITTHHDVHGGDGVAGEIGGIRLFEVLRPLPDPGQHVERYELAPLAPIPGAAGRRDAYDTPGTQRRARCGKAP